MVTTQEAFSSAQRISLLNINDDCLELILRKLDLLDQFQVWKVNSRLKNLIDQRVWRKNLKTVYVAQYLWRIIDNDTFVEYLRAIHPHTDGLMVRQLGMSKIRLLSDCIFANITSFDLGVDLEMDNRRGYSNEDGYFMDEDILMLQRIFPNLKTLTLHSCQITGRYISEFPHLLTLCLDNCQYLESEYFREIFQSVKLRKLDVMEDCDELNYCDLMAIKQCPTLEHIKFADYHLSFDTDMLNDILYMPKIHKLSIFSRNFVFDVLERISKNSKKSIEAFKYNGQVFNFERFFRGISNMKQLRRLSFFDCGDQYVQGIPSHVLLMISKELSELREIHFCTCDLENSMGLLYFVENCHNLEVIDITGTIRIKENFVWRCIELLRKQKWRSKAIQLWIQRTDIYFSILEDPRYIHNNRWLKIDTKKSKTDSNLVGVLKFTFFV